MSDGIESRDDGRELRVGELRAEQVDDASAILAEAFLDEGFFAYTLCADRDKRRSATIPFFGSVIRAHLRYGGVHAATLDDELVGVAIRLPPEQSRMARTEGVRFVLRLIPGTLRLLLGCRGARHLLRVGTDLDGRRPKDEPHWYMAMLAVRPDVQGQGIGGRLTQLTLDRADEAGVGCYFETTGDKTRALYERRGFTVRDELTPIAGGPTFWTMWRDPRRPS